MTKKKIRYSEFPAPTPPPAAAAEVAPPAQAVAPAAPVPAPDAAEPSRRAPVELARALAAARAAESQASAAAPAAPAEPAAPAAPAAPASPAPVAATRLTPLRGTPVIGGGARPTPMRGTPAIGGARPTPMRGSPAIPRQATATTPAAAPPVSTPVGSSSLRERARLRTGKVDLLLVHVGDEWFGVELAMVEEAIDLPPVRHVPEMPPAMLGVITVRGTLTSIYSPAAALGVTLAAPASSLVFRRERGRLGIAVDDVDDVHTLDLAHLRDAPATDTSDGIVLGVLRHRDTLLALVDAEALIAACQTVPAMETA